MQHSTIAAIATAPGAGGIAIVRLSGLSQKGKNGHGLDAAPFMPSSQAPYGEPPFLSLPDVYRNI